MRIRILLLLVFCCLPVSIHAGERPVLLVLGDSLSTAYGLPAGTGWVDRLDARLAEHGHDWRVMNASVSGETTAGGLARLPDALERHQPSLVVIELGGNDGLRGAPIETISANLDAMIRASLASGADVLLVGIRIPPNYGPDYTEAFERIYTELADRHEVPLVPFLLDGVALTPGMMQPDGIHPTEEAQPIMLDHVWQALLPMLEAHAAGPAFTNAVSTAATESSSCGGHIAAAC